jgi:hypothetical protein
MEWSCTKWRKGAKALKPEIYCCSAPANRDRRAINVAGELDAASVCAALGGDRS